MNSEIVQYLRTYLEKKVEGFKWATSARIRSTCPFCPSDNLGYPCSYDKIAHKIKCVKCHFHGNIFDVVRKLEADKMLLLDEEVTYYIKELLNVAVVLANPEIDNIFDFYEANGFDLVPVASNDKACYELEWTTNLHKDKKEWYAWIKNKLNVGVKCGKRSDLTVIDLDFGDIPDIFKDLDCFKEKSNNGWHFFFKYEPDLPNDKIIEKNSKGTIIRKIDILSDGKFCCCYPSIVDGNSRKVSYSTEKIITRMPDEVKAYLLQGCKNSGVRTKKNREEKESFEPIAETIDISNDITELSYKEFQLRDNNLDGCCNNSFIKLGGVLRKKLTINDASFVLSVLNSILLEKPMSQSELKGITNQLSKYNGSEDRELAVRVIDYLRMVEFANAKEVKEALNEGKVKIDKILSYLSKEQIILKKGRNYTLLKKANWKEKFPPLNNEIPFKIPYFHEYSILSFKDMIILGMMTGVGKTFCALNIVKELVDQGVKPYYQSTEPTSRMPKIISRLGLKEGDFFFDEVLKPDEIELEKDAVTIIDWLMIEDYTQTHKIFDAYRQQLIKKGGLLIVFMQLNQQKEWFAKNQVNFFSSLSARYIYDADGSGKTGKWIVDKNREAKVSSLKLPTIPCFYDAETARLQVLKEDKPEIPEEVLLK